MANCRGKRETRGPILDRAEAYSDGALEER